MSFSVYILYIILLARSVGPLCAQRGNDFSPPRALKYRRPPIRKVRKKASEQSGLCSDVCCVGKKLRCRRRTKPAFWPTPRMRRKFRAVKGGGELRRRNSLPPSILKLRMEAASGRRNPKRKDIQEDVLSFWNIETV